MLNKKYLIQQSYEVNDLLSEYIVIQDRKLKETGTFISMFKKIDFPDIYNSILQIDIKMNNKLNELQDYKKENYEKLNSIEQLYFSGLLDYVDKLCKTTGKLLNSSQMLKDRSENKNKISLFKYMSAEKQYKESIKDYVQSGLNLNNLYNKLMTNLEVDNITIKKDFSVNDILSMDANEASKYQEVLDSFTFKVKTDD